MPLNTKTAKEFLNHINVIPRVKKYPNNLHIITAKDSPVKGVSTITTLGLSNYDINVISADKKDIRLEIIFSSANTYENMEDVLFECSKKIIDKSYLISPGVVFPGIIQKLFPLVTTQHILFTPPFLYPNLKNIHKKNQIITWLLAVPITDKEYDYLAKNGYEKLEEKFEKNNIDLFNINRPSMY